MTGMVGFLEVLLYILFGIFCVILIISTAQSLFKNYDDNNCRDNFREGYRTAQMLNGSQEQMIQFIEDLAKRNVPCFIVDELPSISEADESVVYIIRDEFVDGSVRVVNCTYYVVDGDLWRQVEVHAEWEE